MYYNNRRLALSIFWVIVGAVLVVLSLTEVLDSSVYAGMGGALMAVGCLQAIGVIVALVLGNETVQLVLAYSVCLILAVYWVVYMILNKKY